MPGSKRIHSSYTVDLKLLPKVTMMADRIQEINVTKAQWMTNAFYFLYSTAKACLFPFLTIYLRYLGLSPIQTGVILAVRSSLTIWCGAQWTNCAKKFNKRRIVLMVSLYTLIGVFIALTFVPPADRYSGLQYCHSSRGHDMNVSSLGPSIQTFTVKSGETIEINATTVVTTTVLSTKKPSFPPAPPAISSSSMPLTPLIHEEHSPGESIQSVLEKVTLTPTDGRTSPSLLLTSHHSIVSSAGTSQRKTTHKHKHMHTTVTPKLHNVHVPTRIPKMLKSTPTSEILSGMSEEDIQLLQSLGLTLDDVRRMAPDELEQYLLAAIHHANNGGRQKRHGGKEDNKPKTTPISRVPGAWEKFKAIVDQARARIAAQDNRTFVLVLILVFVGGLLGSPVDKLVDNCWFEFLDNIDMIEKYGQHALWGTIGFVFAPTLVTTVIDHVPCTLPFHMYNFAIHVFAFAAFCSIAFILGLFYPMSHVTKNPKKKKVPTATLR